MRLINREDLIAAAKVRCEGCYNRNGTFCIACEVQDMLGLIEDQPTVEQPRWIPVAERLPGDKITVLIIDRDGWQGLAYYDGGWHGLCASEYITHWQPLPQPPTPEECSAVGEED